MLLLSILIGLFVLAHKINKSSKTRYDILIKIYDEIKDYKKPEKILIDV